MGLFKKILHNDTANHIEAKVTLLQDYIWPSIKFIGGMLGVGSFSTLLAWIYKIN